MNKIHLPGLNGIRAIAASIVIIFHLDQFSNTFHIKELGFHHTGMAGFGVTLFFVLSGYLITYLLQIEKEKYFTIDLPKFYIRRILRIWPIYYLAIIITYILFLSNQHFINYPETNCTKTIALYSLFLSNIGFSLGMAFPLITPLWSVGTEEQFYLFWPLIINRSKQILISIFFVIVLYIIIKLSIYFILKNQLLYRIVLVLPFDVMALGGI